MLGSNLIDNIRRIIFRDYPISPNQLEGTMSALTVKQFPGNCGGMVICDFYPVNPNTSQLAAAEKMGVTNWQNSYMESHFRQRVLDYSRFPGMFASLAESQISRWEPLLEHYGFKRVSSGYNPNSGNLVKFYVRTNYNTPKDYKYAKFQ